MAAVEFLQAIHVNPLHSPSWRQELAIVVAHSLDERHVSQILVLQREVVGLHLDCLFVLAGGVCKCIMDPGRAGNSKARLLVLEEDVRLAVLEKTLTCLAGGRFQGPVVGSLVDGLADLGVQLIRGGVVDIREPRCLLQSFTGLELGTELAGSDGPKARIEVVLEVVDGHRHSGDIDIALRRVCARSSGLWFEDVWQVERPYVGNIVERVLADQRRLGGRCLLKPRYDVRSRVGNPLTAADAICWR
mmetsp:Transcript_146128/g.207120  ORF Transcript_146128/g.207120 Transcript_146128/m.207120 type:complete len:246 (-) Transcript_146128:944-1681(-)